jgi:hypothetical protein
VDTLIDPPRLTADPGGDARSGAPHPGAARLAIHYGVFTLSVLMAAAGLGLALPNITEDGLAAVAWIGLALFVVGTITTGWAAPRALRAVRRRWWLLVLPLLGVTSYFLTWAVSHADFSALS